MRIFSLYFIFITVLQNTSEALQVLMVLFCILMTVFASIIYMVEPHDNIESMAKALWYTIVTMTTVGYGDVTPESAAGHLIVSVIMALSVLYTAMPIGIMGNAFTEIWKDRNYILVLMKARQQIKQYGYKPKDLPVLFRRFNEKGDGEMTVAEFRKMMQFMEMGLSEQRLVEIFESIDRDGGGSVDDREFVRALFPNSFHEVFKDDPEEEDDEDDEEGDEEEEKEDKDEEEEKDG